MFARITIVSAVLGLAVLTLAVPSPSGWSDQSLTAECNTGGVQCCNTIESSESESVSSVLAQQGFILQGQNIPIGLNCDSFATDSVGSNCATQPVCCDKTLVGGFGINCNPINFVL